MLTDSEMQALATYNAEVARGLVHTDEWRARMADLQARFDEAAEDWRGYHVSPRGKVRHLWRDR